MVVVVALLCLQLPWDNRIQLGFKVQTLDGMPSAVALDALVSSTAYGGFYLAVKRQTYASVERGPKYVTLAQRHADKDICIRQKQGPRRSTPHQHKIAVPF